MRDDWFDEACESGLMKLVEEDVMRVAGVTGMFLCRLAEKAVIPEEFSDRLRMMHDSFFFPTKVIEEALATSLQRGE